MVERAEAERVLGHAVELALLAPRERDGVLAIFASDYPFARALDVADSIHVHGRVDDTASLPHDALRAAGGAVENEREGYVKYAFRGGVNLIFSSVDVAEDDRLASAPAPRPHLDHVGLDLRRESPEVRALFDEAPETARALGWRHAAQGGPGRAVFCCHTSVAEKHWVYPPACASFARPLELAYGPLEIHAGKMGCDLRPMDPAHPEAARATCGAAASEPCAG